MNRKQYVLLVVLAAIAGLVGGVISSWIFTGTPVLAQKTPKPAKVITAEEFRLVDKEGKIRVRIFQELMDFQGLLDEMLREQGSGLLEFGETLEEAFGKGPQLREELRRSDKKRKKPDIPAARDNTIHTRLVFYDKEGKKGIQIGLVEKEGETSSDTSRDQFAHIRNAHPSFKFYDSFGRRRGYIGMPTEGATLALFAEPKKKGTPAQIELGIFGLLDENPSIRIYEEKNDITPRILLGLEENGDPRLALTDKNKKTRAVLGYTELETVQTGSVEKRPPSSLVLFDKNGKVIWKAP